MAPLQLIGQRYGRLAVLARRENSRHGHTQWLCACDCGGRVVTAALSLRSGKTKSCGCLLTETRGRNARAGAAKLSATKTKHGHALAGTPEYAIWKTMRQRCMNSRCVDFKYYGARGISVCERWGDFSAFFADMGARPTLKHSIDRIDVDGNYEPSNCRWATPVEQANNKRNNRKEQQCSI